MNINSLVPGLGAVFFGVLLSLIAYGIIGRGFTHDVFTGWLQNRKNFYRILGPVLIAAGIAILLWR